MSDDQANVDSSVDPRPVKGRARRLSTVFKTSKDFVRSHKLAVFLCVISVVWIAILAFGLLPLDAGDQHLATQSTVA